MGKNLTLEFFWSEHGGYSLYVNGEAMLECLAKDEMAALTIGEIVDLMKLVEDGAI